MFIELSAALCFWISMEKYSLLQNISYKLGSQIEVRFKARSGCWLRSRVSSHVAKSTQSFSKFEYYFYMQIRANRSGTSQKSFDQNFEDMLLANSYSRPGLEGKRIILDPVNKKCFFEGSKISLCYAVYVWTAKISFCIDDWFQEQTAILSERSL